MFGSESILKLNNVKGSSPRSFSAFSISVGEIFFNSEKSLEEIYSFLSNIIPHNNLKKDSLLIPEKNMATPVAIIVFLNISLSKNSFTISDFKIFSTAIVLYALSLNSFMVLFKSSDRIPESSLKSPKSNEKGVYVL